MRPHFFALTTAFIPLIGQADSQDDTPKTIRLTTKSHPVTDWPNDMPSECAAVYN